jgi:hypothetical protein
VTPHFIACSMCSLFCLTDVTGSIHDEMAQLQFTTDRATDLLEDEHGQSPRMIRAGGVLYRDRGDDFVIAVIGLNTPRGLSSTFQRSCANGAVTTPNRLTPAGTTPCRWRGAKTRSMSSSWWVMPHFTTTWMIPRIGTQSCRGLRRRGRADPHVIGKRRGGSGRIGVARDGAGHRLPVRVSHIRGERTERATRQDIAPRQWNASTAEPSKEN